MTVNELIIALKELRDCGKGEYAILRFTDGSTLSDVYDVDEEEKVIIL